MSEHGRFFVPETGELLREYIEVDFATAVNSYVSLLRDDTKVGPVKIPEGAPEEEKIYLEELNARFADATLCGALPVAREIFQNPDQRPAIAYGGLGEVLKNTPRLKDSFSERSRIRHYIDDRARSIARHWMISRVQDPDKTED